MREIVTIDGRQFELTAEYPLTIQQRLQIIADVRKQLGCNTCNDKTPNLANSMQDLTVVCKDVIVQAPPAITITGVTIGGIDCSAGSACPANLTCTDIDCTSMTTAVVVTLENSGDIDADVALTLKIRESPTSTSPKHIIVHAATGTPPTMTPGAASATFEGVELARGSNNVCASFTFVPYSPP